MLKAEYTRNINKSSLIITPEKDCEAEKDSIEMFRYNDIPHFLKMETQRKDIKLQFRYDITSKRSLEQLLEYKTLDYEMLQMVLHSFDQACTQTEDFMITEHDILLKPEFIFADHPMEHMYYCYLPGNQENICMQFQRLMEYLLQHLNHKDEQALQLAYSVYQQVVEERTALHDVLNNENLQNLNPNAGFKQPAEYSSSPTLNSEEYHDNHPLPDKQECESAHRLPDRQENSDSGPLPFKQENRNSYSSSVRRECCSQIPIQQKESLNESRQNKNPSELKITKQDMTETKWTNMDCHIAELKCSEQASRPKEEISKIKQKETLRKQAAEKLKNMLRKKIYTDSGRYTEEPAVFEADEEEITCSNPTVCLVPESNSTQNQFVFQGADRSRDFTCMHGKMLLGSDLSETDIYIPFPMVSRIHARIEINAQGTFLEDMNSTNGTHVNGELLQYHEKRLLQKGDIISLAGECYSFH